VTNTGTGPCTRDLGQAAVELLVFSGKDRIWSSDDCAPGGKKDVTTLEPGKPAVQRVTWNGAARCPAARATRTGAGRHLPRQRPRRAAERGGRRLPLGDD
jgi:hypothetical protein